MMRLKQGWKNLWEDQRGIGTVEMILILVEIFIPYYQVCIRCIK